MAGSIAGGKAAAATNKRKHGADFYARIGAIGGKAPHVGNRGFAADKDRARRAGKKGGALGHRGPAKPKPKQTWWDIILRRRK